MLFRSDIYDALNAGDAPSLLNPFATIAYVQSKLEQSRLKTAWGRVGNFAYGAGTRAINFKDGISSGGSYYGDTNFAVTPAVIVSVRGVDAQNTAHHGWSIGVSSVTNEGMTILATTDELWINSAWWLACGR